MEATPLRVPVDLATASEDATSFRDETPHPRTHTARSGVFWRAQIGSYGEAVVVQATAPANAY
jgi:hypothetical protein